jgi:hypothetical protein
VITQDLTAVRWRKSSHSDHQGGQCVEVGNVPPSQAGTWRKSSHSDHHGGDCIEVAGVAQVIAVRDSKDPDGPALAFAAAEWRAFTHRIKASVHDLP